MEAPTKRFRSLGYALPWESVLASIVAFDFQLPLPRLESGPADSLK